MPMSDLKNRLNELFNQFNIRAEVVDAIHGTRTTQFHIKLEIGEKINSVNRIYREMALVLQTEEPRIIPLYDKGVIAIEVSHKERIDPIKVSALDELIDNDPAHLPLPIGFDNEGNSKIVDLSSLPHMLIGGATGSGKSVGLKSFIYALSRRKDVKVILIDPKQVEFAPFKDHERVTYISDMAAATRVLTHLAAGGMNTAYGEFAEIGATNIIDYRRKRPKDSLSFRVIIIDELADVLAGNKELKKSLVRLAQKGRAAGFHIIAATQSPRADVVSGSIKANFPTRLSYKVSTRSESRIILDSDGAEVLTGEGDSLFSCNGKIERYQGYFIDEDDINKKDTKKTSHLRLVK